MKKPNIDALRLFLTLGKELELNIVSDSMTPLIRVGDKIKVKNFSFQDLKVFDIILYFDGKKLMCHFVIHKNYLRNSIQTIGLRGKQPDYPITEEDYIGKVVNFRLGTFHKLFYLVHRKFLRKPKWL